MDTVVPLDGKCKKLIKYSHLSHNLLQVWHIFLRHGRASVVQCYGLKNNCFLKKSREKYNTCSHIYNSWGLLIPSYALLTIVLLVFIGYCLSYWIITKGYFFFSGCRSLPDSFLFLAFGNICPLYHSCPLSNVSFFNFFFF